MEKQTSFSESLTKIKSVLKTGDVARLAKAAGYSPVTFRKVFTATSAAELTEAQQRILQVCLNDEAIQQRMKAANDLEAQTQQLVDGGV